MTQNSQRFAPRAIVAAVVTALAASFLLATSTSAHAVAGDPFDPNDQRLFASKSDDINDPTRLFELTLAGSTYSFSPVGPEADLVYNALVYNPLDDYLYAVTGDPRQSGVPTGSLIKIGSAGGYEVVAGSDLIEDGEFQINMGAFDPSTDEFVLLSAQGTTIIRVDADPDSSDYGEVTGTALIDPADHNANDGGSDFAFSQGFLWSFKNNTISRIAPDGSTTQWPLAVGQANTAGAAWTYLGDDLGFSFNATGQVIRIRVTNPDADNPTFTVLSSRQGAPSGQNDGAAIPGTVDLALEKTAVLSDDGETVTWTLTLSNLGSADSSGWTITDELPDGLENVEVTGDGTESVSGSTVTVTGDYLPVGEQRVVTITADVGDADSPVVNDAAVEGNDPDPNLENNTAVAEVELPDDPADPAAPDTGVERESMVLSYAALTAGLLMLLALLVWRGVAARRE